MKKLLPLVVTLLFSTLFVPASSKSNADTLRVLIVIAHPDDESAFAGTIYKVTKEMHGIADLAVITNGEGGYKYSTLAEAYYGIELTDEKTGRENLPRIRKKELMNAGNIIGIRNFFFLDQKDAHYTTDEREPLDTSWDVALIQKYLGHILSATRYDFVFCLLPEPGTHGGHKAATLMALKAVSQMPAGMTKPVVLGAGIRIKTDTTQLHFTQYKNYSETVTLFDTAAFRFDRTTPFGYKKQLNYKIITNWEIAEHKSQGVMQLGMNRGDEEIFWYFKMNDPASLDKTRRFFESLKTVPYPEKKY